MTSTVKKSEDKFRMHIEKWQKQLEKAKDTFQSKWSQPIKNRGQISDFDILKKIGCGAFGTVLLVSLPLVLLAKNKVDQNVKNLVAIKLVEKKIIVKQSQVEHVKNEVKLLISSKFQFLIKMEYFFMDNVYLYLGLRYINGGDMYTHLKQMKKFDENLTKFYAAQVVLSFEYLHFVGVVHRDLKPENVMLAADGYIKLVDFGFCKKIDDNRTYTSCGTPEYLAPEIIINKGHGYGVDWWTLGILIYEMNAGYTPFNADSHVKLYEKIVSGKYRCPTHFSKCLRDLLINLIVVDKSKRFGTLSKGALDIKEHSWFQSFDWDGILSKNIKPTFKPEVKNYDDIRNFIKYSEFNLRNTDCNEYSYAFADFDQAP